MTMFTTAIPVWLNITCSDCSTHQDHQFNPDNTWDLDDLDTIDFSCSECGSTEIGKINISGSANANMRTLEDVRQG